MKPTHCEDSCEPHLELRPTSRSATREAHHRSRSRRPRRSANRFRRIWFEPLEHRWLLSGLYLGQIVPLQVVPNDIAVADIDGDTILDIVVASNECYDPDCLGNSVLFGLGDGSFEGEVALPGVSWSITVGDVNLDHLSDIVSAAPGYVLVHRQVDARIEAWNSYFYEVSHSVDSIVLDDANADGYLDIFVGGYDGISLLLNDGSGAFLDPHLLLSSYKSILMAIGDLNDDGSPDVVAVESYWDEELFFERTDITVFLNDRSATFVAHSTLAFPHLRPHTVVLGDVSGDGRIDMVSNSELDVLVLLGNGDGTFADYSAESFYTGGSVLVTLADIDGDEIMEIVLAIAAADDFGWGALREFDDIVSVLRYFPYFGHGQRLLETGRYHTAEYSLSSLPGLVVGDFNGDQRQDVVIGNYQGWWVDEPWSLSILFNNGRPERTGPRIVTSLNSPINVWQGLPVFGAPPNGVSGGTMRVVFDREMYQNPSGPDPIDPLAGQVVLEFLQGPTDAFGWTYSWKGANALDIIMQPVAPVAPIGTYEYRLTLGPDIKDSTWMSMDQDVDGLVGEIPDDQYQTVVSFVVTPPHVQYTYPSGELEGPIDRLEIYFDHYMDTDSFDLEDIVSFSGPNGPVTVTEFGWPWGDRHLSLVFPPQTAPGDYELVLSPGILDRNGNPIDHDVDGVPGEEIEDRIRATFSIEAPRVTGHYPSGVTQGPVSRLTLNFNHAMDPQSFSISEDVVQFAGPAGEIAITNHRWFGSTQLELTFDAQAASGTYELVLGAGVLDMAGNALDQNRNRVPGELPADQYTAAFTIPTSAPHVVRHSPTGVIAGTVTSVVVDFDNLMDRTSFSIAEDVVRFQGPIEPIVVSSFQWLDDDSLQLNFDPQSSLGNYELVLGPQILDVNGRPMDQDADMNPGESPDDQYRATFTIAQPPRIVGHSPVGTAIGFITTVDLQFDKAMNVTSFSLADDVERFSGPQGTVVLAGYHWVDASTLRLQASVHLAEGAYELVIRPSVLDTLGLALDQDGDGNVGESVDDRYTATFAVDVPPRIVAHSPNGAQIAPIDKLRLDFDQPMNQAGFSLADDVVSFAGPAGPITVTGFRWLDAASLEVSFEPQYVPGAYALVLGPGIPDVTGVNLDQDADSRPGESPDDLYTASFNITQPPRIVASAPVGSVVGPVSTLVFDFNAPMDQNSFSPTDDLVSFTGPNGNIALTGFQWLEATRLQLSFASQIAPGLYLATLKPSILDPLGNPLDQDGDFHAGEPLDDRYTASFDVLSGPRILSHTPSGDQTEPVSKVVVRFNEEIASATFTAADVEITGPAGSILVAGNPVKLNATEYEIRFALQQAYGTYHVLVGPKIENLRNAEMDQDRDGVLGEPIDDRYDASFTLIDVIGPRVIAFVPNRPIQGPLDAVVVTFSEAIPDGAFQPSDAVISGPAGSIGVDRVEKIDASNWRVVFPPQSAEGVYPVSIGPNIEDTAGNRMDQDQDGLKAEPDDIFVQTVTIDRTGPRIVAHVPSSPQNVAVRNIELTFNEAIDAGTFAASLVVVDGPSGQRSATQVTALTDRHFQVTIPATLADGNFQVTVSPSMTDIAGNRLDQDGDHVGGEAEEDAYRFTFSQTLPDLVVTASSFPAEWISGAETEIRFTVTNIGQGAAEGIWSDSVSLAADAQAGGDVQLGSFQFNQPLAPGESYTRIVNVTVPGGVQGRRWVVITTDYLGQLDEAEAAANNPSVRTPPIWVTMRPYPDLQVAEVNAPTTLSGGELAAFSWTVRNLGTGSTSARYWHDAVYLSIDQSLSTSDIRLGQLRNPDFLAPGESYAATVELLIPDSTPRGNYYVIVAADWDDCVEEFDRDGNNTLSSAHASEVVTPAPGFLSVVSFEAPARFEPGAFIRPGELRWTIENTGGATIQTEVTSYWDDGVALSVDDVYDEATDYWLGGHLIHHTVPLRPGESREVSNDNGKSLPHWSPGNYFLILIPDTHWFARSRGQIVSKNYAATPITLAYPNPPDLSASLGTAPESAATGQTLTASWHVTNVGSGRTRNQQWTDNLYLSNDTAFDSGDILIGSQSHAGALEAGQSYDAMDVAFTVPDTVADGDYYLLVRTDAAGAVYESDETNNIGVSAKTVRIQRFDSDLTVTTASGPTGGIAGAAISLDWTVANIGPETTAIGRWRDAVYLSADATLNVAQDHLLAEFERVGSLTTGASYSRSEAVTLPARIEGVFHLFVVSDARNELFEYQGEDNNAYRLASTIDIVDYQPDLVVESFDAPSNAIAGQTVNVVWSIKNDGTAAAQPTWRDAIYLSEDETLDPQDTRLASVERTTALAIGSSYGPAGGALEVTLPDRLEGRHYLFFVADDEGAVYEKGNESNNRVMRPIDLVDYSPDLRVVSGTSPSTGIAGEFIAVDFRIVNQGTEGATIAWNDALYLSDDTQFDPQADRLFGLIERATPVPVGTEYGPPTSPAYARLPDRIVEGTYYIFLVADYENSLFEKDGEANNVFLMPQPIAVSVQAADLQVSRVVAPAAATAGTAVTVSWTVINAGPRATYEAFWQDGLYLSDDEVFNPAGDIELAVVPRSAALVPGQSYEALAAFTLRQDLAGPYHLYVVTDVRRQVFEHTGEDNNTRAATSPLTVTGVQADLQVTTLEAAVNGVAGAALNVRWTVTNAGIHATPAASWLDSIYLSTDDTLDDGDTRLDSFPHNGRLMAGGSYTKERSVSLPQELIGPYFLLVKTDASRTNDVYEFQAENNNVAIHALTIAPPPPVDLQVTSVIASPTAWSGQDLQVEWTVTNAGGTLATAREGGWFDSVYLSRDPYLDANTDLRLGGIERRGNLAGNGGSYSQNLSPRLPAGISGPYYVFVATDTNDRVFERGLESNNNRFFATPVEIALTPPADLRAVRVIPPESGIYGDLATWQYDVLNDGALPAVGTWYDTLYLSTDEKWDLDDPRIARVLHRGDVPPGQSYSETVSATIPAVLPAEYYVIVRTDILGDVRELDEDNNLRVSATTLRVTGRHLTLNQSMSATLASEQYLYYQVDMTAGEDLAVVLSGVAVRNAEVFVAFETLPTRSDFDVRGQTFRDSDIRARVPRTSTGRYYVLLYGRTTLPEPCEFTLSASLIGFALDSMSPSSGGNSGEVTVKILGTHLPKEAEVALLGPPGERIPGRIHPYARDPSAITATFDLMSALPGTYSVEVIDLDKNDNALLTNAFQVEDTASRVAGPDDFTAEIIVPSVIRDRGNRPQWVDGFLVYRNTGNHDIVSPMMTLGVSNGGSISLRPHDDAATDTLRIIALNPQGPANVLPPGIELRLPIFIRVPGLQSVDVSVNWLGVWPGSAANTPVDWSELFIPSPSAMSNLALDTAVAMVEAKRGTTWAQFIQRLGATAAILHYHGELEYIVERLEPYVALAETASASIQTVTGISSTSEGDTGATMDGAVDLEFYLHSSNRWADPMTVAFDIRDAPTVVVVHGHWSDNTTWVRDIARSLSILHDGDINVLSIEWAELASSAEPWVTAAAVPFVSDTAAEQLRIWYARAQSDGKTLVSPGNTHIIGHSHGAHVAGLLSEYIRNAIGQSMARITALDASEESVHWSPLNWYGTGWGRTSAQYVDFYKSSRIHGGETAWGHDNFLLAQDPESWDAPVWSFGPHSYAWMWYLDSISKPEMGFGYHWGSESWYSVLENMPGGYNFDTMTTPWKGIINGPSMTIDGLTMSWSYPSTGTWLYPGPWPGGQPGISNDVDRIISDMARCVELEIDDNTVDIPPEWEFNGKDTVYFKVGNNADNQMISLDQRLSVQELIWNSAWLSWDETFDSGSDYLLGAAALTPAIDINTIVDNSLTVVLPSEEEVLNTFGDLEQYFLILVTGFDVNAYAWNLGELYTENNWVSQSISIEGNGFSAHAGPDQYVVLPAGHATKIITLDGSGSRPVSEIDQYVWISGGREIGRGRTLNHEFSRGAHQVQLSVYDCESDATCTDYDRKDEDDVIIYVTAPPAPPPGPSRSGRIAPIRSQDPNDKLSSVGYDVLGYIWEQTLLPYTIRFENLPEATAAAQLVTITDQLDVNLDWGTFELGAMRFGDTFIDAPAGLQFYQTRVDLRPAGNDLLVDIQASLDPLTGLAEWIFAAIDPQTAEFTQDPLAGFLPPNDPETHIGEGSVSYTVRPKANLASGTEIANMATIVFDWNEPIDTPWVVNRIDAGVPTSSVEALPAEMTQEMVEMSWVGADDAEGSGIRSFDIFVSEDDAPYRLWLNDTTAFSGIFLGKLGRTYAFYSVATDNVGHREETPSVADARVTLVAANQSPVADAGGPYLIYEGDDGLLLDGSASVDPDKGQVLIYSWIVNGVALTSTVDSTRRLGWNELQGLGMDDGPITVGVQLRVDDGAGGTNTAETTLTVRNRAPQGRLVNDGPVDEGGSRSVRLLDVYDLSLTDTLAGFVYSYDFDNDGVFELVTTQSSAAIPAELLADGPATRTVVARVQDKDGDYTEYTTNVEVKNVPPTAAIIGTPAESDEGASVVICSTVQDPGVLDTFTYAWSVTKDGQPYDPNVPIDQSYLRFVADQHGTYEISLVVTDKDGDRGVASHTLTVHDLAPTAAFTWSPLSPDADAEAQFADASTSSPDTIVAWAWDFGGVGVSTDQNPRFAFPAAGTYLVALTVTDSDGSVSSASHEITIIAPNNPPHAVAGGPYLVGLGDSLQLDASGSWDPDAGDAIVEYAWDLNNDGQFDDLVSSDPKSYVSASLLRSLGLGDHSIGLRVKDSSGSTATDTALLQVIAPPSIAAITVNDGLVQRSAIRSLTVAFNGVVDIDFDAFEVRKLGIGGGTVGIQFTREVHGNQTRAVLTFSGAFWQNGSLKDGNYELTIHGDRVRDTLTRVRLDGDNDGLTGGSRIFGDRLIDAFFRLYGDSDGDRDVDAVDRTAFSSTYLKQTGMPGYLWYFDSDGDGDVDASDYSAFMSNYRKQLGL